MEDGDDDGGYFGNLFNYNYNRNRLLRVERLSELLLSVIWVRQCQDSILGKTKPVFKKFK